MTSTIHIKLHTKFQDNPINKINLVTEESHYCHYGSRKVRLAGAIASFVSITHYHCSEDQHNVFQSFIFFLCTCVYSSARGGQKNTLNTPGAGFIGVCEPFLWCWDTNSGPLREQQGFLITESSF